MAKYGLIDLETGEIQKIEVYEAQNPGRWEKVYAKTLVDMLDLAGEVKTSIVTYLIANKDYNNVVIATVRDIAEQLNCSTRTVQSTLKLLEEKNFINRLRRGVIMFSPHVMRSGRSDQGMAVVRRWDEADNLRE